MIRPFFTIGHSTRPLNDFIDLLEEAGVNLVVDVRTVPRSRTNPQFNMSTLPDALMPCGIGYTHAPDLGGLRGKSQEIPPTVNGFWTNDSFHNYADYALTPPFHEALVRLMEEGQETTTAIMCAEAVWWRCHRRIIADYLIAQGKDVIHIMGEGRLDKAILTKGAVIGTDRSVRYPAAE